MLEVTDLTRTYGHGAAAHVAIEGVSLSVAEGELVSIVGPSGCGKTATKEMPEFVKLRAEVSRLVRSHATSTPLPSAS